MCMYEYIGEQVEHVSLNAIIRRQLSVCLCNVPVCVSVCLCNFPRLSVCIMYLSICLSV